MKNNQKGFAVVEMALLGVIVVLIGASGFYVWQSKKEANSSFNTASNQKYSSQPLPKKESDKKELTTAKVEQPATPTPTKTTTKTTTSSKPKIPTYSYGLTISEDGCSVTASGPPGHKVLVKAYNESKGGETTEVIPASGTITVSSGGIQDMTVEASLMDEYGKVIKTRTGTIKPVSCF